ncbi:MAG TPA: PQQ-binding-like beta-propeller repeat protein [Planctomycetota bacterium]|nr:PQQ-binding-like beta-propeller repeat protein [Planctomycetota bacterium]
MQNLLALSLFVAASLHALAADTAWPAWRGPNRDGVAAIPFQLPAAWPKKLTEIWSVPVGPGYSSPIIDGKTIYLQSRTDTDELIAAFDASNGHKLWEVKLESIKDPMQHEPASTPAFHDGALYIHSLTGTVHKIDSSGKKIWRRDLPSEWKGEKYRGMYGVAASPLVVGDTLALPVGDKETGKAIALKLSDGSTAWEQPTDAPGYSSFLAMKLGGEEYLATLLFNTLAVFKKDGARFVTACNFELAGGADGNAATPVALGPDRLLITGHDATIALKVAPGAAKCEPLWKIEEAGGLSTPVFANGRIYLHNESSVLCLDPANGQTISKLDLAAQYCALVAWDGVLVCRLHEGTLKFIDIRKLEMKLLADYPAAEEAVESWSSPTPIAPAKLVMRTGGKLVCLTWIP